MRRLLAIALTGMALWASAAAAADGSKSPAWIGKRVNLFMNLCPATAPSFGRFKAVARQSGFKAGSDGMQVYKATEIVASIKNWSGRCDCLVSFGTNDPKQAANMILRRLLTKYGSKFQADDDPKSLGELMTSNGNLSVQIVTTRRAGGQWVGAVVHGNQKCPA
ncbi:hypothetical protein NKI36_07365 [Mesorhizobium caraganae]|uniref:Uncharacterized protein n=1 Tax=Mesorhizobium caraganae TaxID=483206 RepID=A0ABV1YW09_9HYPH